MQAVNVSHIPTNTFIPIDFKALILPEEHREFFRILEITRTVVYSWGYANVMVTEKDPYKANQVTDWVSLSHADFAKIVDRLIVTSADMLGTLKHSGLRVLPADTDGYITDHDLDVLMQSL